jgi:uncharacterized membrane protein
MNFLKSMLSDGVNDTISSKRVITFLSFLLCAAAFIADLGWDLKVDFPVFQSMMYIVIAGLGFTASEKFAPK